MRDYKDYKPPRENTKLTWVDIAPTVVMVIVVIALFAGVIYETGKEGGALDHALGIPQQTIQERVK